MNVRIANWFKAILLAVLIIVVFLLARTILHAITIYILAGIITYLLNPIVTAFQKRRISRPLAIIFSYFSVLLIAILIAFLVLPPFSRALGKFVSELPGFISELESIAQSIEDSIETSVLGTFISIDSQTVISEASSFAVNELKRLISYAPTLLGLLADAFLIFIVSLYMLLMLPSINNGILNLLPNNRARDTYKDFNVSMCGGIDRYIIGQLLLMASVGVLAAIGLWIIGIPSPGILGFWAALGEFIPYLGPIIGAIPAVLFGITISPIAALLVILLFVLISILESYLLAPNILGKSAELPPLIIIFAIVAGGELAGLIGIILAIPAVVVALIFIKFVNKHFAYVRPGAGPDRIVLKDEAGHPPAEEAVKRTA